MMAKIGIEWVVGEGGENGTLIGLIERIYTDVHCVNGNGTRMGRVERIYTDVHCVNGNGTRRTRIARDNAEKWNTDGTDRTDAH
jgi:hypothetical protein